MTTPALEAIKKVFGEELSPEVITNVPKLSKIQLRSLLTEYVDGQVQISCPPRKKGELRPFIHHYFFSPRSNPFDYGSFKSNSVIFQEDVVKKHLLYCHSLCISDPGEVVLRLAPSNGDIGKETLANYFTFLLQIKPLLEARIITLVDDWPLGVALLKMFQGKPATERSRNWPQDPNNPLPFWWPPHLWKGICNGIDDPAEADPTVLETRKQFWNSLSQIKFSNLTQDSQHRARLRSSLNALEISMIADRLLEGQIDPYFPTAGDREVFTNYIQKFGSPRIVQDGQLKCLTDLIRIHLPSISELPIDEIVKIRQIGDHFEQWRNALERGIERIRDLPPDLINPHQEKLRLMREELDETVRRINNELSQSTLRQSVKDGTTTFAIGVTAGSISNDPTTAVASGAVTMVLNLIWKFFKHGTKHEDRESKQSFVRHYSLFE